MSVMGSS